MTGPPGSVLLIDIENIIGQKARPTLMAARVSALIRQAGPEARAVAACASGRITEPGTHVLHEHDVRLLTVGATKNAADEALLAEARALARQGCRRFVVASNDSTFAQVAELGTLEIVVWKTQKIRPSYAGRASKIHRLACPPAGTTPGVTGSVPATAPRPERTPPLAPSPRTKSDPTSQPTPHVREEMSRPPRHAGTPIRLALSGLTLLAAGVIVGVGVAIGDLTVHYAVRRRVTTHRRARRITEEGQT
ncbi:hypothetical protein [Actinoplanes sp. NPDC049802]|uniref:hypothetical protein n=1 Tax=Actinoplanes sp. NPDC049802 TaxID=3154742 RepID=UPI0033EA523D